MSSHLKPALPAIVAVAGLLALTSAGRATADFEALGICTSPTIAHDAAPEQSRGSAGPMHSVHRFDAEKRGLPMPGRPV